MIAFPARLLRGSVSDGSEESLAATSSEGDDVMRGAAPVSPLVRSLRYGCHPPVIPRHFRHRVMPGTVPPLLSQVPSKFCVGVNGRLLCENSCCKSGLETFF